MAASWAGQYTAGASSEIAMLSAHSTRAMFAIWLISLLSVIFSSERR